MLSNALQGHATFICSLVSLHVAQSTLVVSLHVPFFLRGGTLGVNPVQHLSNFSVFPNDEKATLLKHLGKRRGLQAPPKNTAIPHLSKRRTSLDLPVKTRKKSGRVEEPRRIFQSSYCAIMLSRATWTRPTVR